MSKLLSSLNEQQAYAVKNTEGPMLILAGAGSGKTRTIIHKIAYILEQNKAQPDEILALTFTNKAAQEMKNRIAGMGIYNAESVWMSTFHSLGARILRRHAALIGYTSDFVIYDEDDKKKLIKESIKQLDGPLPDLNYEKYISRAKENRTHPEEYEQAMEGQNNYARQIAQVYALYEKRLKECNAMDFQDLLSNMVLLFETQPAVLDYYQKKFKYILIDEYQDTNYVQYLLTALLAKGHQNLCVCGDDDQSIYAFRGADIRNILEFEKDFPAASIIKLEQNYRSSGSIIQASNAVIANNMQRKGKRLFTKNEKGEPITFRHCYDGREEARYVASEILKQNVKGVGYDEMAVLYRTNAQSRTFEAMFLSNGIGYQLIGGLKFYDREEVKDILAYLRLGVNDQDDISFMRVYNVPRRGLGTGALQKIREFAEFKSCSLMQAASYYNEIPTLSAKAKAGLGAFYGVVQGISKRIEEKESIGVITKYIIDEIGYFEYLASKPDTSEQKTENVNELISSMYEFEQNSEETGVAAYLQHVSLISALDESGNSQQRVSLMTVHNAKGLEFHTVFLAGMEEGLFPHVGSLMENNNEEERRLCYVGMTRAKQVLYMTAARERLIRGRFERFPISRFVFEADRDCLDEVGQKTLYAIERGQKQFEIEHDFADREFFSPQRPSGQTRQPQSKMAQKATQLQKKSGSELSDVQAGDKIKHEQFGVGTIISVKGEGEGQMLQVAFVQMGIKNLLTQYAPITKV